MEDKTLLNKARATNKRFHDFKKYMMDLTRISNDLNNEIIIDNEKLKTLYAEINSLQNKITVLDEKKCKLETGVDELTIKMKNYELLKIHLAALNQRKQIFEDHTIEEGFKEQEDTLQNKINIALDFFNEKFFKLDEEINSLELKLANRAQLKSIRYEKECNKYKKLIKQLNEDNDLLSKKINLVSKLQ